MLERVAPPWLDSPGLPVRDPAGLVVGEEEALCLVDDDEIAMRLMRRVRQGRGIIQISGAVGIDDIRAGEGPVDRVAVEAADLGDRERSPPVKGDARDGGVLALGDRAAFEF